MRRSRPQPRARASRLDPEARRQQLLGCAIRVFAERGMGRGGHAQVAEVAGVAVPTVFAYFKTRGDLVNAVLTEVARFYQATTQRYDRAEVPAPRVILDAAIAFVSSIDTDPDYARILLEWSASVRDEMWPLFVRLQRQQLTQFAHVLARGQREGTIPGDLDTDDTAAIIVGAWHLIAQMKFMRRPPEQVHRFLLTLLRAAIGAPAVASALN